MKELLDAARTNDFQRAKEIFDVIALESNRKLDILNEVDGRNRSVAHYAALYDDSVVTEWLHRQGADFFQKDDGNKTPIDIAVLLDCQLRKKNRGEGEALEFFKRVVLNPIQQVFHLECGESCDSVRNCEDLIPLSNDELCERFLNYNNLQAVHVFAACNRISELRYLKARGIDLRALDDDGNSGLHFSSSVEVARFFIDECKMISDEKNKSDGYTPAHVIVERAAMEDLDIEVAKSMLSFLCDRNADFSIKSDSGDVDVAELAIELIGTSGPLLDICLKCKGVLGGLPLSDYIDSMGSELDSSEDSISVASHDDKVLDEDGNASSSESSSSDEDNSDADFIVRKK
jgi:hypothetical protein